MCPAIFIDEQGRTRNLLEQVKLEEVHHEKSVIMPSTKLRPMKPTKVSLYVLAKQMTLKSLSMITP